MLAAYGVLAAYGFGFLMNMSFWRRSNFLPTSLPLTARSSHREGAPARGSAPASCC